MTRAHHTPIPSYRSYSGTARLTQGFRPFFLAAAVWAVLALALSFAMIKGHIALPSTFDAVTWHFHELFFGYITAAIAGFLLTAIPNWTGRLPLQGGPLLALVLLWLGGRVAIATSALIGVGIAAAIDLSFLAALVAVTLREIIVGKNWRNLVPISGVFLLLATNALLHAETVGLVDSDGASRRLPIAIMIMLITLIGGRVVPSFTRNWLVKRNMRPLPAPAGRFDRVTLVLSLVALGAWTIGPDHAAVATIVGIAAILQFIRLARWRGWVTRAEPLLWILHLGYLWIPIGLALLAASHWLPALPATGALHALTAGAMGTMTLAVMSRAILGHTGLGLTASPGLTAVFILIMIAAASRVAATLSDGLYTLLLMVAAGTWIAAFLGFLVVCGPILLRHRQGQ